MSGTNLSGFDIAIEIGNCPCRCAWVIHTTRNQMKVQVSGTFSESNGIDPVTACDPSDQLGGPLHHTPPLAGFISAKVDGASAVSPRIKQTPTEQRSR